MAKFKDLKSKFASNVPSSFLIMDNKRHSDGHTLRPLILTDPSEGESIIDEYFTKNINSKGLVELCLKPSFLILYLKLSIVETCPK